MKPKVLRSTRRTAAKLNEVFNFVTPWPRGEALGRNPRYARSNRVGVSNRGVAQRKRASSGSWRPGSRNSPPRPSECSAGGSPRALGARGRRIVAGHSDHLVVAQRQRAAFGTRRSGSRNSPPRPSQAGSGLAESHKLCVTSSNLVLATTGPSSSGRTPDSHSGNGGSSPPGSTTGL